MLRSDSHAPAGAEIAAKLTFPLDHSTGADHLVIGGMSAKEGLYESYLGLNKVGNSVRHIGSAALQGFGPQRLGYVRRLLANRPDVFPDYHQEGFVAAFAPYFEITTAAPISGSERTLYRMRRRGG